MHIEVTFPILPREPPRNGVARTTLELIKEDNLPNEEDVSWIISSVGFPVFKMNGFNEYYVLLKDLAHIWGYPSSYQLINKLIKNTAIERNDLLKSTDQDLNLLLLNHELISSKEVKFKLFYTKLSVIYTLVQNKEVFFGGETEGAILQSGSARADEEHVFNESSSTAHSKEVGEGSNKSSDEINIEEVKKSSHKTPEDKITISQVFPHYGIVESHIEMSHSFFNSLNSLAKLNYYKSSPNAYRFLPNNKLTYAEREIINRDNDFSDIQLEDSKRANGKDSRKNIGKKKSTNSFDLNSIDLTESVIPGQGYIQEFNVNHLCKVPSYYITTNNQQAALQPKSGFNMKRINQTSNSSFLFNENLKTSKSVQKLLFSNEADNNNYTKYYYTKSYRGPGSGNYKDASVMNRINRIQTTTDPIRNSHKVSKQLFKPPKVRYNQNLKGLVHDKFSKKVVDRIFAKQRTYTEDYINLEMLHSNAQFNLLVNSYREISEDTWENYYKYKMTDFEQLGASQKERAEIEARDAYIRNYQEWQKGESDRQEKLRTKTERAKQRDERVQMRNLQKQREIEEKRRRRQLEASFNDPFGSNEDDFLKELEEDNAIEDENSEQSEDEADLHVAKPPPTPIETPQLDIQGKFTLPTFHPEIIKLLPADLRDQDQAPIPSIKRVIRYTSTYPDTSNPEILNKLEIIKLPNSNSMGWDNLRKYRE
ncbi:uncharacterized protein CANTADRAFT_25409 [Suhomyces tanzawaensis NRRL Y-17324]|uniref:Uncharacterized protein n=1 Tax=Suhomyces tanzawaensis NRRL Y-17324 TaxID=984487 RepID=A0A1E4SNW1_9ASCO|nr:uncharacterized protein CANTADRAFT_25409 [Suhomyces tanzawaensis NRRL Y-17324]ODV81185.1 hypothetical protein CANTADRAFT_25409 [Suhomyces tanzawaensis NRRL Y-17324]